MYSLGYGNSGAGLKEARAAGAATMAEQTTRRITETEVAYKRSEILRAIERAIEHPIEWEREGSCRKAGLYPNGLSFKMCCILYGCRRTARPFIFPGFCIEIVSLAESIENANDAYWKRYRNRAQTSKATPSINHEPAPNHTVSVPAEQTLAVNFDLTNQLIPTDIYPQLDICVAVAKSCLPHFSAQSTVSHILMVFPCVWAFVCFLFTALPQPSIQTHS